MKAAKYALSPDWSIIDCAACGEQIARFADECPFCGAFVDKGTQIARIIDAATGKNMTVAGSKADKSKEDDVEKPPPPPPPKWMPGFIANAKAADDADFFEAAKPQQSIKREGFDEDGGGGAGPGPVRLDGDDDEPDDDSGDLDDLDDLLG